MPDQAPRSTHAGNAPRIRELRPSSCRRESARVGLRHHWGSQNRPIRLAQLLDHFALNGRRKAQRVGELNVPALRLYFSAVVRHIEAELLIRLHHLVAPVAPVAQFHMLACCPLAMQCWLAIEARYFGELTMPDQFPEFRE